MSEPTNGAVSFDHSDYHVRIYTDGTAEFCNCTEYDEDHEVVGDK